MFLDILSLEQLLKIIRVKKKESQQKIKKIIKPSSNILKLIELLVHYFYNKQILKLDHLSLLPLVTTELEVLAPLDWFHGDVLLFVLTVGGLHLQHDLFGGLGFLVEDRFGLTTITALFSVISSSTLAEWRFLAFLVLGHLEVLVFSGGWAVGFSGFWYVYHFNDDLVSVSS